MNGQNGQQRYIAEDTIKRVQDAVHALKPGEIYTLCDTGILNGAIFGYALKAAEQVGGEALLERFFYALEDAIKAMTAREADEYAKAVM